MNTKQVGKVMSYLCALHSWEGSDCGHIPEIKESLMHCRQKILSLTGLDPYAIPTDTGKAIEFLKNHTKP